MWRHIAAGVVGPSHARTGAPCQDSHDVRLLGGPDAPALSACVADGAGSASHSDEGSALACSVVVSLAEAHYTEYGSFSRVAREEAVEWCEAARTRISEVAAKEQLSTREYATTLCVALLSPKGSAFFQIGDGAIVARRCKPLGVLFWPQSGEYANSTMFLTGQDFDRHVEFSSVEGDFVDVALMTDGVERLALSFEGKTPHAPFFDPLLGALHGAENHESLSEELCKFLDSESMKVRSDDDKTVVLASQHRSR